MNTDGGNQQNALLSQIRQLLSGGGQGGAGSQGEAGAQGGSGSGGSGTQGASSGSGGGTSQAGAREQGGSGPSGGQLPLQPLLQLVLAELQQTKGGSEGAAGQQSSGQGQGQSQGMSIPITKVLELMAGGSGSPGSGSPSSASPASSQDMMELSQELSMTLKKLKGVLREAHGLAQRIESALGEDSGGDGGSGQSGKKSSS